MGSSALLAAPTGRAAKRLVEGTGAGNALPDPVAGGVVPLTRPDVIFRQATDGSVITNAHRFNRWERRSFRLTGDSFIISVKNRAPSGHSKQFPFDGCVA